jgi:hypothetical protein
MNVNHIFTTIYLRQDIYLLKILANGSIPEIYENESMKIVAPLSTFCSLYNLFLLPILDEEFLKGEAIFSKLDLIKMSAYLKDACIGVITLMHPEVYVPKEANHHNLVHHASSDPRMHAFAQNEALAKSNLFKIKMKAKYFNHLFQVKLLL